MTKPLATHCLTEAVLQQLARGELSPIELAEIEEHVGQCQRCQAALDSEASDVFWMNDIQPVLQTPVEPVPEFDDCEELDVDLPRYDSILKLLGPTDNPDMLGRIGSYEIAGVIGRGGMGVVFKAFEPTLNRFVAIKMLSPHLAESGAARKRFAREGQAAAAVVDDFVLPIYSVAEWRGAPYLVTQFLRGSTLQKRIQQEGPLELKEIIRIGLQTARGLAAAHAQGLVHRDVKPSNILLDGTVERAMLTDFGLARAVDDASITRTGIISGTPQFMSPEQANGDSIDHRSDLFSLGGVLYAMCTSRPPFRADTTFGVLRKIRETSPRSISEINPDIPMWMELIVAKLLAKNKTDRFSSANELADLLEQCLAHLQQPSAVGLPPQLNELMSTKSSANHAPAPNRRRRRLAWWGGLVMLAGLAFGLHFSESDPTPGYTEDSDDLAEKSNQPTVVDFEAEPTAWNAIQQEFDDFESGFSFFENEIQFALEEIELRQSESIPTFSGDEP